MLVAGIFLGINAVLEGPREIGRWHLAAAREFWRNADYGEIQGDRSQVVDNRQKGLAKLEDALKWSPEEPSFLLQRAEWRSEVGEYEGALQDYNVLMEKFGEEVELLLLREKVYHLMGRHAEAVVDAERVNNLGKTSGIPSRAVALNIVAYAKALGKIDLDSALQEINEAIKFNRNAAFLDTRGFIYYQMGKYDLALKDLDPAVSEMNRKLGMTQQESDLRKRAEPDIRKYEIELRKANEQFAVFYYHRALIHEKLGHSAAAAADRKRVRELIGRDGDEKLF